MVYHVINFSWKVSDGHHCHNHPLIGFHAVETRAQKEILQSCLGRQRPGGWNRLYLEALETNQPTFYSDIFSCVVVEQSILSIFIVFPEV